MNELTRPRTDGQPPDPEPHADPGDRVGFQTQWATETAPGAYRPAEEAIARLRDAQPHTTDRLVSRWAIFGPWTPAPAEDTWPPASWMKP